MMILEIAAFIFALMYLLDVVRKYGVYYKEWVEKPKEEEMTQEARRMFA
jgi:hypothetical protein